LKFYMLAGWKKCFDVALHMKFVQWDFNLQFYIFYVDGPIKPGGTGIEWDASASGYTSDNSLGKNIKIQKLC